MRIQMSQENGEMGPRDHISLRNYSFYFLQWSVLFRFLLCLTSPGFFFSGFWDSSMFLMDRLVMTFIGCRGLQICTAGRGWNVAPETDRRLCDDAYRGDDAYTSTPELRRVTVGPVPHLQTVIRWSQKMCSVLVESAKLCNATPGAPGAMEAVKPLRNRRISSHIYKMPQRCYGPVMVE